MSQPSPSLGWPKLSPSPSPPPFCGITHGVERGVGGALGRGFAVGTAAGRDFAVGAGVGRAVAGATRAGAGVDVVVEAAAGSAVGAERVGAVGGFDATLDATVPQAVNVTRNPARAGPIRGAVRTSVPRR